MCASSPSLLCATSRACAACVCTRRAYYMHFSRRTGRSLCTYFRRFSFEMRRLVCCVCVCVCVFARMRTHMRAVAERTQTYCTGSGYGHVLAAGGSGGLEKPSLRALNDGRQAAAGRRRHKGVVAHKNKRPSNVYYIVCA